MSWPARQADVMTRILVAVDETDDSVNAARTAHGLFGDDAEYLAVNVASIRLESTAVPWYGAGWGAAYTVPYGGVWDYRSRRATSAEASAGAETPDAAAAVAAERVADQSGLPNAEAIGDVGDPADAILRAAHEHDVDVIVVGSHDRGWLSRLWRPSVSDAVVKHTERPVLVVR
jgi:nucleotide-binding universal stress UspA family protein